MIPPGLTEPARDPDRASADPTASEATGLPGFKTWSGVYWLVTACLIGWIVFLAALPEIFS